MNGPNPEQKKQLYSFGPFRLDAQERVLFLEDQPLPLTPKVIEILIVLVENSGHITEKEVLLSRVWPDTFVEESALAKNVSLLRKALGGEENTYIETVPKRGYRFVAAVQKSQAGSAGERIVTAETAATEAPGRRARNTLLAIAMASVILGVSLVAWQWERLRATPPTGRVKLAVLPFENLSGDSEQDYLSDGLTEEMITQLARLSPERLAVIARTSSMHFKASKKTVAQIGQELGVDYVLEGSIRREGERLRISAQLIQVKEQTHIWAENYERDVRDLIAVQDNVAQAIAANIRVQLTPQELAAAGRGSSARAASPEVYQLYLKGRYFWNKRTEAGYVKAIHYFQEAIQKDPDSAPAYAGLADAYALLGSMTNSTLPRLEAMPRARAFAEKALALDESLAEAHTSLAFVKMHFEQDWATAEKEFQRTIALNPSYATAHHWYAYCLIAQVRVEEALREIRLAQQLDPLSLIINTDVAELLYYARRYDEAIRQAQKTLEMDSSFALAHRVLGWGYEQKGMYKESIAEMQTLVRLSGRADYSLAALGRSYALSGNRKEAEKLLRELLALDPQKPGTSIGLALLYAALGNKDQAFFWLDKSAQERMGIILIKVEPYFDSLRSDPRFRAIERRMALTQD